VVGNISTVLRENHSRSTTMKERKNWQKTDKIIAKKIGTVYD